MFIERERLIGVLDDLAELGVMELIACACEWKPRGRVRDTKRAHGVPDADEVDADLDRVLRTKILRGRIIRLDRGVAVEIVGAGNGGLGKLAVGATFEQATFSDKSTETACGVGAAAESEQVDVVAGLPFFAQSAVALHHVARQAVTKCST